MKKSDLEKAVSYVYNECADVRELLSIKESAVHNDEMIAAVEKPLQDFIDEFELGIDVVDCIDAVIDGLIKEYGEYAEPINLGRDIESMAYTLNEYETAAGNLYGEIVGLIRSMKLRFGVDFIDLKKALTMPHWVGEPDCDKISSAFPIGALDENGENILIQLSGDCDKDFFAPAIVDLNLVDIASCLLEYCGDIDA